ncbi:MAG: hypothetical protein HN742_05460 [Lentisphaerae bacterium]|nr:hypothetical protein [Lentisphaerota bacterium]MBT5608450.1 hypothetical protein [Lentisphaerota bacterium]MBT7055150.1 hypothetical protein [Lentisphaerota bacterium]MBT7841296.1 hypothetical protein [Lentisphaerota bacterium]
MSHASAERRRCDRSPTYHQCRVGYHDPPGTDLADPATFNDALARIRLQVSDVWLQAQILTPEH